MTKMVKISVISSIACISHSRHLQLKLLLFGLGFALVSVQGAGAANTLHKIDPCSGPFNCSNPNVTYLLPMAVPESQTNCTAYYTCVNFQLYLQTCPPLSTFDKIIYACVTSKPRCFTSSNITSTCEGPGYQPFVYVNTSSSSAPQSPITSLTSSGLSNSQSTSLPTSPLATPSSSLASSTIPQTSSQTSSPPPTSSSSSSYPSSTSQTSSTQTATTIALDSLSSPEVSTQTLTTLSSSAPPTSSSSFSSQSSSTLTPSTESPASFSTPASSTQTSTALSSSTSATSSTISSSQSSITVTPSTESSASFSTPASSTQTSTALASSTSATSSTISSSQSSITITPSTESSASFSTPASSIQTSSTLIASTPSTSSVSFSSQSSTTQTTTVSASALLSNLTSSGTITSSTQNSTTISPNSFSTPSPGNQTSTTLSSNISSTNSTSSIAQSSSTPSTLASSTESSSNASSDATASSISTSSSTLTSSLSGPLSSVSSSTLTPNNGSSSNASANATALNISTTSSTLTSSGLLISVSSSTPTLNNGSSSNASANTTDSIALSYSTTSSPTNNASSNATSPSTSQSSSNQSSNSSSSTSVQSSSTASPITTPAGAFPSASSSLGSISSSTQPSTTFRSSSISTLNTTYLSTESLSNNSSSNGSTSFPPLINSTTSPSPASLLNFTESTTVPSTTTVPAKFEHTVTSLSNSNTALEGASYSLMCSFRQLNTSITTQVDKFVWLLDEQKLTPGMKINISSDTHPDAYNWWNSTIKFTGIVPSFSGEIVCQVFHNNSAVTNASTWIGVIGVPHVEASPLSQAVRRGDQFTVNCTLVTDEGDAVSSMTTIAATRFVWTINGQLAITNNANLTSSNLSTLVASSNSDATVTCRAHNAAGNSTTNSSVYAVNDSDKLCGDSVSDGVHWVQTKSQSVFVTRCPSNSTGLAYRFCDNNGRWQSPDFTHCVSLELHKILSQLNSLQLGIGVDSQLSAVFNDLAKFAGLRSAGSGMNVGDLNASIAAILTLGNILGSFYGPGKTLEKSDIQNFANTISSLLQLNNKASWNSLNNQIQTGVSPAVLLMRAVDIFGEQLVKLINTSSYTNLTIVTPNLVIQAVKVTANQSVNLPIGNMLMNTSLNTISIPALTTSLIGRDVGSQNLLLYSTNYKNIEGYLPVNGNQSLNSGVAALTINGLSPTAFLDPPITLLFKTMSGAWSTTNCTVVSANSSYTLCQCSHLTNFAILMSLSPTDNLILSIISIVGCSLSIAALFLTIVIYVIFWKSFKSDHAAVLINFCIALIVANIIFLAGVDRTQPTTVCLVIAALLHYFYLAAFFLMLAEGVEMLLYTAFVFHIRRKSETAALIFAAWFLPAVVVGISLAVTRTVGYGSSTSCWLDVQSGLIWAFVAPAITVILVNFVILIVVLYKISRSQFPARKGEQQSRIRSTTWNILVLCPILGITWVFGVLSVNQELVAFQYIFAVANSLQGVFVFIFHAACHNRVLALLLGGLVLVNIIGFVPVSSVQNVDKNEQKRRVKVSAYWLSPCHTSVTRAYTMTPSFTKAKGSYSTSSVMCFDWVRTKSTTSRTTKSPNNTSSNSESTHPNIRAPIKRKSSRPRSLIEPDAKDQTLSGMPSNLQALGHYEVISYPQQHATVATRLSTTSWASSAVGSTSTVSTDLSSPRDSYQAAVINNRSSGIDYTCM